MKNVLFTLTIICLIIYGLNQAEQRGRSEGRRLLEESIRRAAVTCYAIEGSYPESISYMEKHYGVIVDTARYTVFYEIFASNIFPNITVLEVRG
jgi:hypothetical protein